MFGWADAFDWEEWAAWLFDKWWLFGPWAGFVRLLVGGFNDTRAFIVGLPEYVSRGMQRFFGWLIDTAVGMFAWLPDHQPLALPDPASWGVLFRALGIFDRFIDLPVLFGVAALLLTYHTILLLYAAYRAVLGLIPMFK